jgi:phosphopantothenoylcysteine decarboxylase/phosphopantothenate--cysteine ligase
LLADKLSRKGAKVTLILGPTNAVCCLNKKIRVINFRFFDELKDALIRELNSKKYDTVIHSAAVSDYKPAKACSKKFSSRKKIWRLNLVPTEKIINRIKKIDRSLFLVGFKFEPATTKIKLLKEAKGLIEHSGADLVVANTVDNGRYAAYLVGAGKIYGQASSKTTLADKLIKTIRGIK